VYAQAVELHEAQAAVVVAREVHSGSLRTGVLLAGRVEGPVETIVDTPRALLAGLSAGIGIGLVLFLFQLLLGRRK
jgi:hypothetical protein